MLSVILEWLRGHLEPSDAGLELRLHYSSGEDGWMLVDIVRDDPDTRSEDVDLLRDYFVIPDLNSRAARPSSECATKALSCGTGDRTKRNIVARPLSTSSRHDQHLQRVMHGEVSASAIKIQSIPVQLSEKESLRAQARNTSTAKRTTLICDGVSSVKKMKYQCVADNVWCPVHYHRPQWSKRLASSRHVLDNPSRSHTSFRKTEHSFTPVRAKKINKSAMTLIDDFSISRRNDFSSGVLCILEDIGRVSNENGFHAAGNAENLQNCIDTILHLKQCSRVSTLQVDKNISMRWVISGQTGKMKSFGREVRERSLVIREISAQHENKSILPKKPMLALEWRSTVDRDSNAEITRNLYSAAGQRTSSAFEGALVLWEAAPVSLSIKPPVNVRLLLSRILAPIVTLQVLWAHLAKLLSLRDQEEERQLKKFPCSTRQSALIHRRNRALSRYMKERALAEKKTQQRCLNKRRLERTHRAMVKSRGDKSNRKRALANGRFNCMVGRRGQ